MLAVIEARMDADTKTMLTEMKANQAKADADRKADHEEMMAMMKAWGEALDAWSTDTKDNGEETVAYQ
jgi:hypothetical protein